MRFSVKMKGLAKRRNSVKKGVIPDFFTILIAKLMWLYFNY